MDSTPSGDPTEKISLGNVGVRGFHIIDDAKTTLESECPATVSCADILAFAARDAASFSGLPHYRVPAGRRDGLASLESHVLQNLPSPDADVAQMEEIFNQKGLNYEDLVTLLGAHSIGVAHCFLVDKKLYEFNETHMENPNINRAYARYLRSVCPPPGASKDEVFPLNVVMPNRLSNVFYTNLLEGKDAITADLSLLEDEKTRELVSYFQLRPLKWVKMFVKAMVKLGNVEVLTRDLDGEIRRSCRAVNQ